MELFTETFVSYAGNILPWFAVGTIVAYVIDRSVDIRVIRPFLGKVSLPNILVAKLVGMASPLSIMSALPITGELIRLGAQPLMLFGFLLAERAYDLQSFFIISDLFGLKIAVLNAAVILVSLVVTTWSFRKEKFKFIPHPTRENGDFWRAQGKTLLVVLIGIAVGAILRVVIPLTGLGLAMTSQIGGVITSLVVGFGLYFGTILGNYPVARALADLGMTPAGTMIFLSVSPIFNLVVIMLFLSVVRTKYVLKMIGVYVLVSLFLSLLVSVFH